MRYLKVPAEGPPTVIEGDKPSLANMQAAVGGLIEMVSINCGDAPHYVIVCNEEGVYTADCKPNLLATALCLGQVFLPVHGMLGDVLVFGDTDSGELTDVPEHVLARAGV